jgi:hypothetical protein
MPENKSFILIFVSIVVMPLVSVVFSGLVSTYIAHRLTTSRAQNDFLLRRLEDLFLALERFLMNYNVLTLPYMPVMAGRMPLATVQQSTEKFNDPEAGKQLLTVEMLVRIYFPQLRPRFDRMKKLQEHIGEKFLGQFFILSAKGQSCAHLAAGYSAALEEVNQAAQLLREGIFEVSDKIQDSRPSGRLARFLFDQWGW